MWDGYSLSNEIFDVGIDHTVAAVEERKRLEREATDFDIWLGLEQDDILTELLLNTRIYHSIIVIDFNVYCVF